MVCPSQRIRTHVLDSHTHRLELVQQGLIWLALLVRKYLKLLSSSQKLTDKVSLVLMLNLEPNNLKILGRASPATRATLNCLNLGTSNHGNQYQSELNWVSFTADQCDHRRDEVNEMRGLDELNYDIREYIFSY